jgi:hypothetical protein
MAKIQGSYGSINFAYPANSWTYDANAQGSAIMMNPGREIVSIGFA